MKLLNKILFSLAKGGITPTGIVVNEAMALSNEEYDEDAVNNFQFYLNGEGTVPEIQIEVFTSADIAPNEILLIFSPPKATKYVNNQDKQVATNQVMPEETANESSII